MSGPAPSPRSDGRRSTRGRVGALAAIGFMRALAPLPLPLVRALGGALGHLLFMLARRRRHVALVNLALCFPQLPAQARRALARRSFVYLAQSLLDRAWLWHGRPEVMRRRVVITGALEELQRPGPVVVFAPHFYGLDAGANALLDRVGRPAFTIYSSQSNPTLDAWVRRGRARFGAPTLVERNAGLKPVVRALRDGWVLYLLPDMDLGPEESVFVPFFGVPAATVPSLPRFAELGRARVVPVVTRLTPTGYEVEVHPAWAEYPSGDLVADTARMNQRLEDFIRPIPAQYYWVHKRFKTRPPGAPPVY